MRSKIDWEVGQRKRYDCIFSILASETSDVSGGSPKMAWVSVAVLWVWLKINSPAGASRSLRAWLKSSHPPDSRVAHLKATTKMENGFPLAFRSLKDQHAHAMLQVFVIHGPSPPPPHLVQELLLPARPRRPRRLWRARLCQRTEPRKPSDPSKDTPRLIPPLGLSLFEGLKGHQTGKPPFWVAPFKKHQISNIPTSKSIRSKDHDEGQHICNDTLSNMNSRNPLDPEYPGTSGLSTPCQAPQDFGGCDIPHLFRTFLVKEAKQ